MKKQHLLYVVLTLLAFGLITACSKSDNSTPTPNNPVVGQFDINRVEITDVLPASLSISNMISTTGLGTDTYIFNNDNTYSNQYSVTNANGSAGLQTETGTYAYVASTATPTVTLTPTPQAGQSASAYVYFFNSAANELSTGKTPRQATVPNPTTGANQTATYNQNVVYRKK